MNTNFKVIGLTILGIKPEPTASEADALTNRPSELSLGKRKLTVGLSRFLLIFLLGN